MRGCLSFIAKSLASLFAILFVITALLAVLLFNIGLTFFDPQTIKNALAEEHIYQNLPALMTGQLAHQLSLASVEIEGISERPELEACYRQALGDEALAEIASFQRSPTEAELALMRPCSEKYVEPPEEGGMPQYFRNLTQADWEAILATLLPAEWLQAQTESLIDQLFAYLDSSDPKLSLKVSMVGLKENLVEDAAMQAFRQVVHAQPPCSQEQAAALSGAPLKDIPLCNPPDEVLTRLIEGNKTLIADVVAKIPDEVELVRSNVSKVSEMPPSPDEGGPFGGTPQQALRKIRLILRLSPLLPGALLLLVTLFGVRSPKGWLRWWGIPLLIVGLVWVGASLVAMPLVNWAINTYIVPKAPMSISPLMLQTGLDIGRFIASVLMKRIGITAGLLTVIGLGMLAISSRMKAGVPAGLAS